MPRRVGMSLSKPVSLTRFSILSQAQPSAGVPSAQHTSREQRPSLSMKVVCLSDTHNRHRAVSVPDGDLLIHAGDMSNTGSDREIAEALRWFAALPHPHKIIIAGNHDWLFDIAPKDAAALIPRGVHYLQDSGCTIAGFRCWGSPVQPWFLDWAFNRRRGSGINRHWKMIPANTDRKEEHKIGRDFFGRRANEHRTMRLGARHIYALFLGLNLNLHGHGRLLV